MTNKEIDAAAKGQLSDDTEAKITLRDGTVAWTRPLGRDDRETLAAEYQALSPHSRRLRFLASVPQLTESMLDRLVDEVDGVEHVALVMVVETADGPVDVAIGRIVRYRDLPDAADVAVTVKDAWQGRGVASALLPRLVQRRPPGVTYLLTEVAADNPASLAMLRRMGETHAHVSGPGVLDVEVDLDQKGVRHRPPAEGHRLHPALDVPHARCRVRRGAS